MAIVLQKCYIFGDMQIVSLEICIGMIRFDVGTNDARCGRATDDNVLHSY